MGLRPVDLAREHGISTQAVRNYEQAGILPAAERSPHGYRLYGPEHAQALRTFIALVPGHGHQVATDIMRAANQGDLEMVFRLIDQSHAGLLRDRQTLDAVTRALGDLTSQDVPELMRGEVHIGSLARRLGLRPATLRKWEKAGIVRPERDAVTGYRAYPAAAVRDAHLAHQLRRGGYPLERIASAIEQVRNAGSVEALESTLEDWRSGIARRSSSMLRASARLARYLDMESREGGARG
ncbi:TioE family transcriptional regulator [Actinocorallia sp. B10E7]|uniref:TioE family transcriptional regulator n=1 Tax=Actinocorallia sp. B10E7 TaxID=3153558 RepID=UPI00325D4735